MRVTKSHWFLFLASLGLSFILVFSTFLKNSGMSSLEQVLLRIFVAMAFLVLFLAATGNVRMPKRSHVPFFSAVGTVWGLLLFSSLSSIAFGAPIVVAGALIYTQPIYTALISFAAGHERASPKKIFLILVAVMGAFLASGFYLPQFGEMRIGVLFAAFTGFVQAVYIWLKRNPASKEYAPLPALANTMAFSMPAVLLIGAALGVLVPNPVLVGIAAPTAYQLFIIVLLAFFSTLLPYGALNFVKNDDVGQTTEGLLLLLDALLKVVWSVLFFSQFLSFMQYLGVGLMLTAIYLSLSGKESAPVAS